jgi:hypothetical protein
MIGRRDLRGGSLAAQIPTSSLDPPVPPQGGAGAGESGHGWNRVSYATRGTLAMIEYRKGECLLLQGCSSRPVHGYRQFNSRLD